MHRGIQDGRDDPFLNIRLGSGDSFLRGGRRQQFPIGGSFLHKVKNQILCSRNIHESADGRGGEGRVIDIFLEELSVSRLGDLTEKVQQESLVVAVCRDLDRLRESFADLVHALWIGRGIARKTCEGIFIKIVPHAFAGRLHHFGGLHH